jgi:hypothetical protein
VPFSETELLAAVTGLNQAILDEFADDSERLSAYQLGLTLSDLVWLTYIAAPGEESSVSRPSALFGLFARSHLATVHTLLSGAGTQLPSGAATIVSRSLDNWADWIDVNSGRIKSPVADAWSEEADVVLHALRVQGWIWRSVLVADPEVAVQPSMGAWVQAGSSIARAAKMIGVVILRRFWPLVLISLVALGGLLYLVISNLTGASQVWASLVTVAAVVGSGAWGVGNGVSQAFGGVGYEIWSAARLDASAWGITWLPALTATTVERVKMERRGVAMPEIRKSLDILPAGRAALASLACRIPMTLPPARTPTPPSGSRTLASASGSREPATGPSATPSAVSSWPNCCLSPSMSSSRSWTSAQAPVRPPGPSSTTTPPRTPSSPTSRRR